MHFDNMEGKIWFYVTKEIVNEAIRKENKSYQSEGRWQDLMSSHGQIENF